MNNQLTKLENGKVIKKENVTEEQLINKLYQYERLGTVGKIKSKFKELEVNDDIWHSQFAMARASEEYLKIELDDYKTKYENLKREFDFSVKFREINQGLKEQCRKYKLQLAEKEKIVNNYGKFSGLTLREFYEQQNQDKINFAIAELEKVQTFLNGDRWYEEDITPFKVLDFIDQQISELKQGR